MRASSFPGALGFLLRRWAPRSPTSWDTNAAPPAWRILRPDGHDDQVRLCAESLAVEFRAGVYHGGLGDHGIEPVRPRAREDRHRADADSVQRAGQRQRAAERVAIRFGMREHRDGLRAAQRVSGLFGQKS